MPDGSPKSPELLALCLEDLNTGIGYSAVARKYGIHKDTLHRYFPGKGRAKFTEADFVNWRTALEEGYSYKHVAEMYNVSRETVQKYLPGMGWDRKQISSHGALMSRASKLAIV